MAQGVYHIFNTAKMRLMEAAYQRYPNAISTNEIANRTGMEKGKVSRLMSYYHSHNYRYFRRLKKRHDDGSYRYKINKKGARLYQIFVMRVLQGYDLNLKKKTPIIIAHRETRRKPQIKSDKDLKLSPAEIAPYIRLSHRGEHELGVKPEDALTIVGIVKEKLVKESVKAPVVTEVPMASEMQVLIPSKIYTLKDEQMTSEEMAEVLQFGINEIHKQLESTSDANKIKKLQDKKRKLLLWIHYNPDIKQFLK